MDKFKIDGLKREINRLTRDLDNCDLSLKEITRAQGTVKATITKLNYHPQENRDKIADAERNLETIKQEYNQVNRRYYRIIEEISQKKNELAREENNPAHSQPFFHR